MLLDVKTVETASEIEISTEIYNYAAYTFKHLVPLTRKSGFQEIANQRRGEGDFLDLVAKLTLMDMFGRANKVCSMELTFGTGDQSDLKLQINRQMTDWNIKTSKYAPYREGLNLFVKKEEIDKPFRGYIQCFVHLGENNKPPHIHVAGACLKGDKVWNKARNCIIKIPQTNHYGIGIPVESLTSIYTLIKYTDDKF